MRTVNPARAAAYRVFEAINTKDLSAIDDVVTADFVDHGSPFPLPPGPAGYRQILTFVTQVLDVRYEVLDEIVTEDRIVFGRWAEAVGWPRYTVRRRTANRMRWRPLTSTALRVIGSPSTGVSATNWAP